MKRLYIPIARRLELGHLIRDHRVAAGMSQADAAVKARMSQKYLGEIETGKADPRWSVLARICRALDIDGNTALDAFFTDVRGGEPR